jgi:uncharacterized membrane protein
LSTKLAELETLSPVAVEKPLRWESIDLLRGLAIVVMTLDHVRDFFSVSAGVFEPTDLSRTSVALFFTRWVTHFCAPVFVLLAGVGAYQAGVRGRSKSELSAFLATRGLWLILLEILFISPFGWSFQLNWSLVRLQVIWAIGCSMLLLSGMVRLPSRWIGVLGFAMIAGHNLLDGSTLLRWAHNIQFFKIGEGHTVASLYPLVPWVGVLMVGFGLGEFWTWTAERRRKWVSVAGLACLGTFLLLRLSNSYGDPNPWTPQKDAMFTTLSALNVWKYPPSLSFLLITLGPALLGIGWLESRRREWLGSLLIFGRVPMFFYLIHLPLIHGLAVASSYLNHGSAAWLLRDPFALRRPPMAAPESYGFGLFYFRCANGMGRSRKAAAIRFGRTSDFFSQPFKGIQ